MKRLFKRFAVSVALLLLCVAAYLGIEHLRGTLAFNRRIKQLSAAGEQLSVEALRPRAVPAAQNSAVEFNALTNSQFLTNIDASPPSLRFVEPGKAIVPWRLDSWATDRVTNNWQKVGAELGSADELLRTIHSAARKSLDTSFAYEIGFIDFKLGPAVPIKRASQVLNLAALYEVRNGQRDAAHEHLLDMIGIAAQNREPLVIYQLIRQACAAFALNATWAALQTNMWTDEQLAEWQQAWSSVDFAKDMARSFEMERAMTLQHYRLLKNDSVKRTRALREIERTPEMFREPPAMQGFWFHWVNIPVWRMAFADQDALLALRQWDNVIARDRFIRSNSWAALNAKIDTKTEFPLLQEPEGRGWWDRFRFVFATVSFGINDNVIRRTLCWDTQTRMTVTAIALRRFQMRTGQLPSQLNELVPDYLAKVPRDDMDGGVLHYKKNGDGNFILYSVGFDGKDDEGDATLQKTGFSQYRQMWDGRDAVWPRAASAEEANATLWPARSRRSQRANKPH